MGAMLRSWPPLAQAVVRGVIGGAIVAGLAYFTALQANHSNRDALIAAGVAFFSYLAVRGGLEGALDQGTTSPSPSKAGNP